MKLYPHLSARHILLGVDLPDKEAVLRRAADFFAFHGIVPNADGLFRALRRREDSLSTGIGCGIGLPHAALAEASHSEICLMRLAHPIDFESLDGQPVDLIIALVFPEHEVMLHLKLLAGLARLCKRPDFIDIMRRADRPDTLLAALEDLEERMPFH